jgi:spore germination protein YaaH
MRRGHYLLGHGRGWLRGLWSAASAGRLEVSGWLPYWKEDASAADALAHIDQLTEINPFVYVLQADGTIQDMAGIADEPWASLFTVARAKKVKIIPTIMTSNGAALHEILSDPTRRVQLEDDITTLVNREGFDGIDIDFEGKQYETGTYFSTFLKGLYQRMGKKWVMCTIESRTPLTDLYYNMTMPATAGQYANDLVEINKYCDRVRFMTYDQQTADQREVARADERGEVYGPVGDVVWVEKAIREAMKTIPANKIVVGVATYGYEWSVTAYADGFTQDLLWSFGPNYATPIAAALGITPTRQASGEMGFSYVPTTTASTIGNSNNVAAAALAAAKANNTNHTFRYMTWSDAFAIKQKVDLAKRLGVRGVAFFRLDGGEDMGMWDVLK